MGFNKFANAAVFKPAINLTAWDEIRHAGNRNLPDFRTRTSAKVVLEEYDPSRFLLSHCTIVASVDTEDPGLPTGRQMIDGRQVDRRYPDFYISSSTQKFINNNYDAWERKLLLSSFRTFIGGDNFVEHLQIPELSKGKIVDAAARDIGDSIYIDILVATDKKHRPLIDAITSGQMSTLSMGCQVSHTVCSKCGNVAEDEVQLCNHIRFFKGQEFTDSKGSKRRIAELCGHISSEPGSVKFIEASWVANPAFAGAVLRNILAPTDINADLKRRIQVAFSSPIRTLDVGMLQKAASAYGFDGLRSGDQIGGRVIVGRVNERRRQTASQEMRRMLAEQTPSQQEPSQQEPSQQTPSPPPSDPLEKPSEDIYNALVDRVVERLKKDVGNEESSKVRDVIDENRNDTLIRSALKHATWRKSAQQLVKVTGSPELAKKLFEGLVLFRHGGWYAVKSAKKFSGREILAVSMLVDRMMKKSSMAGTSRVYQTVITVGGTKSYENVDAYLSACRRVIGRDLTNTEQAELVQKGKLYSLGS